MWMGLWQILSGMATGLLLIAPLLKRGWSGTGRFSLYGELLEIAGGKERIRFYLNQYRPDFEPPSDLDGFIANLHAAKTKYTNNW
jgi:hypothetical protein